MARLTTKLPLNSLNSDEESISSQIDRLNHVIQAFNNEKLSPLSRFRSSRAPSIDSFLDSGKISLDGSEFEEEQFKFFERQSMLSEDFRSHELRESDKTLTSSKLVLEVNEQQLEKLCDGLLGVKKNFHSEKDRVILSVSGKQIILVLKERSLSFPGKNLLALSFCGKKIGGKENCDFGKGFKGDIDELMKEAFSESFSVEVQNTQVCPSFISACEQVTSKNNSRELKLLIDKLNWEITELCFLKENYSNKIQSLNDWEKHLRDKQTDLSIQETQITSKKALMEKDLELLSHQRKNLHQEFQENRRKQEILKKTLQDMQSTSSFFKPERLEKKSIIEGIILKPRRSEPTSELDNEISSLEKEINSLESSEFCHSPRSDQIKTRLDRLKTKLSSLKSKRVINASLERSNSANKLHLFDLETKKLSHSRSSFRGEPLNSSSVFNSNKGKKENSPKKTEKTMGSTEELQKYLKLRENRLNEKEEDLSKRENFIFNNLGKLQDNIGLVSIVQNEHRNLKILRNDLEKRQKCLEQQVFNYSRKFSEVKAREKEILVSVEKFECFLKQKKQIEDQLVFLASLFEEC